MSNLFPKIQCKDPSKIPNEIIHEIICRRLINLPESEKQFPRILSNIEEACWFYTDEFCADKGHNKDKKFERKFAHRIYTEWSLLRPQLSQLPELQDRFWLDYKSQIPSFGCVIFNARRDHLLFCIYKNKRDKIEKKLDFPKGKVDQDETDIECAVREVQEETNINLDPAQINANQYVKVETLLNRMVTLYFVEGIEMDLPLRVPVNQVEIQGLMWIPVAEYIHEAFRQSTVEHSCG
jgi:mRNA-decapping enzyme subunit 2